MIEILYDCKDFIVCVKPAGYISEISDTSPLSLPAAIMTEQNVPRLFTVHRLDKEVSGVMVYAKNEKSAANLSLQISNKLFDKQYITEVEGTPDKESDTLRDLLFYDRQKNKTYIAKRERKGVKDASLEYRAIKYCPDKGTSFLIIKLHTGRTHQIRVQLASRKLFIRGDRKYGSSESIKPLRLHSFRLSFLDTQNSKKLEFYHLPEWLDESCNIEHI